ncbi:MAG: MFS transporter, partial [Erysipelotrichaceae bacterium]|nr:MFS transporter [Erysipelotrichaceae bacterium]
MEDKMNRKHILLIIAMAGMVGCSVGLVQNVAGVYFDPIAREMNIGRGPVSFTLTIDVMLSEVGTLLFKKISDRIGGELTTRIGAILLIAGTVLSGLSSKLIFLYIFSGIKGIGGGLIHLVTASLFINNWFEKRNGLMVSIAMAFSGVAGAIFSPLLSSVINSYGWKIGYMVNGALMFVLLIPLLFLKITYHPEDSGLRPYGFSSEKESEEETTVDENKGNGSDLLLFVYAIIVGFVTCVPQFFPGHAGVLGDSSSFGSLLISLSMITNIISKVILGSLVDKIGPKKAVMITSSIVLIGSVLMLKNITLYLGALLFGFCYAGSTVGLTSISKDQYSKPDYLIKYPILSFVSTAVNALGSPLVGFIYDGSASYSTAFIICIVMMAMMLIDLYMLERI